MMPPLLFLLLIQVVGVVSLSHGFTFRPETISALVQELDP